MRVVFSSQDGLLWLPDVPEPHEAIVTPRNQVVLAVGVKVQVANRVGVGLWDVPLRDLTIDKR